ncbi:MAG: SGNH/GDSL hydrolase family protein, partial [Planctomycetes bacterium]|nr:SGNH/GDSL hydrolase family protein [Planctomycetota bacterium]
MSTTQRVLSTLAGMFFVASTALAAEAPRGSFAEFDARAKAGARLNVVFFGASLTWGANASDPAETSYRAVMRDRFEQHYPAAHFRFRDAAIGGTGSQLGAFRLDRDVLAHRPDLVFVDFTANDDINSADPETLASYESILRRLVAAGIPVVQVAFPFRWDIETAKLPTMKRRIAHQALAEAYGSGWGDAVTRICREVDAGRLTCEALWVTDGVHPHDPGYREFAAAAWDGYLAAVKSRLAPRVPPQPLHGATYMAQRRVRLAELPALPEGWCKGRPNLTAVNHDWLMSRWLDDLIVARNRKPDEKGTPGKESQPVKPLRLKVEATAILLFGESTADS